MLEKSERKLNQKYNWAGNIRDILYRYVLMIYGFLKMFVM